MSVFTSKWDAWTPQTQKIRTDNTDNAVSAGTLSVLSVQKTGVLPEPQGHAEAGEGPARSLATSLPLRTADPTIETYCLICGRPADDSNSNLVANSDEDDRLLRLHIAPECYRTWFERAFGRTPKPEVLTITKLPKP